MDWTIVASGAMGVAGVCAGSLITLKGTRESVRNAREDAKEAREDARQARAEARADARQRDEADGKTQRRDWTYDRLWRALDLARTDSPIDLLFSLAILRMLDGSDVLQPEDKAFVEHITDHVKAVATARAAEAGFDITGAEGEGE